MFVAAPGRLAARACVITITITIIFTITITTVVAVTAIVTLSQPRFGRGALICLSLFIADLFLLAALLFYVRYFFVCHFMLS